MSVHQDILLVMLADSAVTRPGGAGQTIDPAAHGSHNYPDQGKNNQ